MYCRFSISLLFLATFAKALPPGYTATEWAAPFDIEYPAAITAAADGTVYVSCDGNGSLGKRPDLGKVVSCRDTDGDGKADRFIDFIPYVASPRGGHFVRDTLYLVHPPFVSAFRDTDGDGVADEQKVLLENLGFGHAHPRGSDHTTNGCRMGIDGWLYIAVGDFGMEGTRGTDGKVLIHHGGAVARVRPDGTDLELYSTNIRNICDIAISPELEMFSRDNTNDGKGWNIRLHHFTDGSDHGYPRLYKNFADEVIKPVLDLGGGSGTGALYLAEPGHEEMLFTCDWTVGEIYHDRLSSKGASFEMDEQVFMKLDRAVDIDVDGSSNLYVCDWRDGRFRFAGKGKKVGMVQKLHKEGLSVDPLPAFHDLSEAELIKVLNSPSAVRRLEAQREILARKISVEALVAFFNETAESASLYSKIATLYTISQSGKEALPFLRKCLQEAELRPFALRGLTEHESEQSDFSPHLDDASPRVQLQALIGLRKLGSQEREVSKKILQALEKTSDDRLHHTARGALMAIADHQTLLSNLSHQVARQALMRIHRPEVVTGLLERLKAAEKVDFEVLSILARLSNQEAEWDLESWWGTRPDDRGPYFQPEAWSETKRIWRAFEEVLKKANEEEQLQILDLLSRNRVPILELDLGDLDPVRVALLSAIPDTAQMKLLAAAATDPDRSSEDRLMAYQGLRKGIRDEAILYRLQTLGKWLDQGFDSTVTEREVLDFTSSPAMASPRKQIREIAAKAEPSVSRVAWRTLLTLQQSPLSKKNTKEYVTRMLKKNPREEGLFLALADLRLSGFDAQIQHALESDNDTLIAAATRAREIIAKANESQGKLVAVLQPEEVTKLALASTGDAAVGKRIYLSQGCIACHAIDQAAVQKGPYLGSSGSKFTKEYLIESILDPNAVVSQGFQTEKVTMKDGSVHLGFVTREVDDTLDLRNIAGIVTPLAISEISERDHLASSMMPPGLAAGLTVEGFNDLIAYLVSLKE